MTGTNFGKRTRIEEEKSNEAVTAAVMRNNNCSWSALKICQGLRTAHWAKCGAQFGIFCSELCSVSSKPIIASKIVVNLTKPSYQIMYARRVPLREDRLEQPRTDFRVQSVILLTNSDTTTSETPHSNLCIRKRACGTSCKRPLVRDWMLQSAQQCRYSILCETNPRDDSHELWAVVKEHGDWSLEIRILEAYCRWVCYGVLARWFKEVAARCTWSRYIEVVISTI